MVAEPLLRYHTCATLQQYPVRDKGQDTEGGPIVGRSPLPHACYPPWISCFIFVHISLGIILCWATRYPMVAEPCFRHLWPALQHIHLIHLRSMHRGWNLSIPPPTGHYVMWYLVPKPRIGGALTPLASPVSCGCAIHGLIQPRTITGGP